MSLSDTGGHGRGDQSGRIIGDVINHGKREMWGKRNVHYHIGMKAGENTLNAVCARCGEAKHVVSSHVASAHRC
jgi:ADP-ribosyl-[dinitrogen reductase] hydrolase